MESTHGRAELLGPRAELPAAGLLLELDVVLALGIGDVNDGDVAVDIEAGDLRRAIVGLGQGVEIGSLPTSGDVLERLAVLGAEEGEHLLEVVGLGGIGHSGDGLLDRFDVLVLVGAGGAGRVDDLVVGGRAGALGAGVGGGEAEYQQGDQEDAERATDDGQGLLLRGQRRPGRPGSGGVAAGRLAIRAGLRVSGELLLGLLVLAVGVLRLRHLRICPSAAAVMAFHASVPDGRVVGGLVRRRTLDPLLACGRYYRRNERFQALGDRLVWP